MNASDASTLTAGPLRHATLLVRDAQPVVAAYAALGLMCGPPSAITSVQAQAWGQPDLAGCALWGMAPAGQTKPLLRLIVHPDASPRPTRFSHGWLALEILVRDVDALARRLPAHGFEMVGPPADLDVSPNIRAMQLIGPAGEMLYLTQVKAAVPPFRIPLSAALPAQQDLGPLFIAVLSTPSRAATLAACAPLAPQQTLQFDTRVTVLNRALDRAHDARWPVATLQFEGDCLLEVDEVVDARVTPRSPGSGLPMGLAWIGIAVVDTSPDPLLLELSPGAWIERLNRS